MISGNHLDLLSISTPNCKQFTYVASVGLPGEPTHLTFGVLAIQSRAGTVTHMEKAALWTGSTQERGVFQQVSLSLEATGKGFVAKELGTGNFRAILNTRIPLYVRTVTANCSELTNLLPNK